MKRDLFKLIIVEGTLEVDAVAKLLATLNICTDFSKTIDMGGRGDFWASIGKYNNAAKYSGPILGLADLEDELCAPMLINTHLPHGRSQELVLRVAVRMLESWFLADRGNLATFLGISSSRIPLAPDLEENPKRLLVNLARHSRKRIIREDLVPQHGSRGVVGKGYRPRMVDFINNHWDPRVASSRSPSLANAILAIEKYSSQYD